MPIRLKILLGALALTLVTGLFGLYSRAAEQELGALSFRLYDDAFMSMSYLRAAQNELLVNDAGPAPAAVEEMQQNLAIARDRAMSPRGRQAAIALSDHLDQLRSLQTGRDAAIASIRDEFDTAVEVFAGDAFRFRREVGQLMTETERGSWCALAASVALALLITIALAHAIVPQLQQAAAIAQSIAEGRLDNVIAAGGGSETGRLLRALAVMQQAIISHVGRVQALLDEQASDHAQIARQQARVDTLVQCFGASIAGVFRNVSAASQTVAATATELTVGAGMIEVTGRAAEAQLARSVDNITASSTATRSLSEALRDIGGEAKQTELRAQETLVETTAAVGRMLQTREAAAEIKQVVSTLGAIARQTRMLALNATIEAARAGTAGLGFAVVATEVKRLAQQADAVRQSVAERVARILDAADATVTGVGAIDASAREVHALSASIAKSVATQDVAAQAIWTAMSDISVDAAQVREGVDGTLNVARRSAHALAKIGASAVSLARDAAGLSVEVADFLDMVRSIKGGEAIEMVALDCPATLRLADIEHAGRLVSGSGVMVHFTPAVVAETGAAAYLQVAGLPDWLPVRVAGAESGMLQLQPPLARVSRAQLQTVLAGLAHAA